jgi:hypothetical protein
MELRFSTEPKILDREVQAAFVSALKEIPQAQEIYTQYLPDEDDPADDQVRIFVVMEEMHITAHGQIADVENEIIDALPEDYRYRYEFLRLFKQDGQVAAIVAREQLRRIYP